MVPPFSLLTFAVFAPVNLILLEEEGNTVNLPRVGSAKSHILKPNTTSAVTVLHASFGGAMKTDAA